MDKSTSDFNLQYKNMAKQQADIFSSMKSVSDFQCQKNGRGKYLGN